MILAAAIYQLTPAKDICLRKCRGPIQFLLGAWKPGYSGALRMGVEHGAWCVGCCWALMAALFALGVMSVGWMAFVAALIAVEKLLPWKAAGEPRHRDPAGGHRPRGGARARARPGPDVARLGRGTRRDEADEPRGARAEGDGRAPDRRPDGRRPAGTPGPMRDEMDGHGGGMEPPK